MRRITKIQATSGEVFEVVDEIARNKVIKIEPKVNENIIDIETNKNNIKTNTNNILINANNILKNNSNIEINKNNINIQKERIDNIIALPDGSTTADAELVNIRIGYNGEEYTTAGNAVREQVKNLHLNINDSLISINIPIGEMIEGKFISSVTGLPTDDVGSSCTDFIDITKRKSNKLKVKNIYVRGARSITAYDVNKNKIRYLLSGTDVSEGIINLTDQMVYIRITSHANETPIIEELDIIKNMSKGTCYVDSSIGNDLNSGESIYKPFKTITKALTGLYNKIYVKPGIYNESLEVFNRNGISILPTNYIPFNTSTPKTPQIIIKPPINTAKDGLKIINCYDINLENISVDNSYLYGFEINNCHNINLQKCIASNIYRDGFKIINTDGVFRECETYNIGTEPNLIHADGFNIHGYGNTEFINCIAHDCLDDGISHHDGCTGLIVGGEYYNCGKGGVASPTHGAKVDIYNVKSHHNRYGLYTGLEEGKIQRDSIIANNLFYDNSNVGISANGYKLYGWNNILRNNGKATESINGGTYFNFESNQ